MDSSNSTPSSKTAGTEEAGTAAATAKADLEARKFEWQKRTFWWDWIAKLAGPILAAMAVALIGARVLADLKPIHLETGNVTFDVAAMERVVSAETRSGRRKWPRRRPLTPRGAPACYRRRRLRGRIGRTLESRTT
jgi:hypothetical protein